jgi:uncharacterized membrane protein
VNIFCYAPCMLPLACMNSMDTSSILSRGIVWFDLFLWIGGAVFLNQVVIVNALAPTAEGQPPPPFARRLFFLLVGACVVLLLATVSAVGPLLDLSEHKMAECLRNRAVLLVLLFTPAVVFVLQTVFFQRLSEWLFGGDKKVALVTLVITSVFLSLGVDWTREVISPVACEPESAAVYEY